MERHSPLLCAKQVGAILGVTDRTAAALLRDGEIAGFKLGGRVWRVKQADLDDYIARQLLVQRCAHGPALRVVGF